MSASSTGRSSQALCVLASANRRAISSSRATTTAISYYCTASYGLVRLRAAATCLRLQYDANFGRSMPRRPKKISKTPAGIDLQDPRGDVLADVLGVTLLRNALYRRIEARAPWGMRVAFQ